MSPKRSVKRSGSSSGTNGAKMLVTAASLTVVVGGWAVFTIRQPDYAAAKGKNIIEEEPNQEVLDLPPLPTLVPEPSPTAIYRYVAVVPEIGSLDWSPTPGMPFPTPVVDNPTGDKKSDDRDRDSNDKKSATKERTDKSASKEKPSSVADTKSSK